VPLDISKTYYFCNEVFKIMSRMKKGSELRFQAKEKNLQEKIVSRNIFPNSGLYQKGLQVVQAL